jgi:hypothetical protein
MKIALCLTFAFLSLAAVSQTDDSVHIDSHLSLLSTLDDTADVNIFGADNDAGWIYTAESTKRAKVLMNNRCPTVSIAKGDGKFGDSLQFKDKTKDVLFYQLSPNLEEPQRNWGGTVSLWLKPNLEKLGKEDCYPVQITDGDWNHGGFFVRFPAKRPATFEFGTVSKLNAAQAADSPDDVTKDQLAVTVIDSSRFVNGEWTMVTFTFEDVNPRGQEKSVAKIYLNEKLEGEIRQPLHIKWMEPGTPKTEQNAAIFLGINYVGGVDDLRIYERALSQPRLQKLHDRTE